MQDEAARSLPHNRAAADSNTPAHADDSKGHAWIRRTLVPPSFFKRAITCRLRADQPPYVLLVSDSGFDVWRGGVDEDAPDAAMDCEGEGEAPPYLTHVDYWEMREEISAIDVLHDGDGDVIITGSSAGLITFWQWSSSPSSLPRNAGRLCAVGRVQLEEDDLRRPFHIHHLRVCHASHCLVAATLDGRIAAVSLPARAGEEEKGHTAHLTPGSPAYQRLDGIILSLDVLSPSPSPSSLSEHPPRLRVLLGYCSPPLTRHAVSCSERMWLTSIERDGVASFLVPHRWPVTCEADERIQLVRTVPQSIHSGVDTLSALVLTSKRALLLSCSGWEIIASTPLPVSALPSCAMWWASSLLCAFDGGGLFSLHVTAMALRWRRLGSAPPCVDLALLPSARFNDCSPLVLAVGDMVDSAVLKMDAADVGGVSMLHNLDIRAPLWDLDLVHHWHGDQSQLQLISGCGVGAQSSLRMLTEGVGVEWQSASTADFELLRSMMPLRHHPTSPHHLLVLCSFLSSSRVLSCHSDLTDLTDVTRINANERTIAAAFAVDGSLLVQVMAHTIRVVRVNPNGRTAESVCANAAVVLDWNVRALGGGNVRITHAGIIDRWLVLGVLPSSRLVLCELTVSPISDCTIVVSSPTTIAADISCLSLFRVEDDARTGDGILVCAVGTHASSLALYRIIGGSSSLSTPSLHLITTRSLSSRDDFGQHTDGDLHIAESCLFVPKASLGPPLTSEPRRCGLLVVGVRDGWVVQYTMEPTSSPSLAVVATKRLGDLPVQLCPASHDNQRHTILAVSGHLSMLRPSPLSTLTLACTPVADVFEYVQAVHFSTPGTPAGSILALRDARLHVLSMDTTLSTSSPSLQPHHHTPFFHSARLSLPHTPRRVLYHPLCRCVVVALDSPGSTSLALIDVRPKRTERGEEVATVLGRYERLTEGERVMSIRPLVFDGSDACCLVVGTAATGLKPRFSRGRLLLFHLITADSASASALHSPDAIGRLDIHLLAAVRTRAAVTDLCVHPTRGVLCATGSWLTLFGVQGQPGSAEGPSWFKAGELEMRNRILSLDVRHSVVFVSVYKDGVSAVSIDGDPRSGTSLIMRPVLMDPTPRTARQLLTLGEVSSAPLVQSLSPLLAEPRVLAVDEGGHVVILRAAAGESTTLPSSSPASAAAPLPLPQTPPLMTLDARGEPRRNVVVARLRSFHSSRLTAEVESADDQLQRRGTHPLPTPPPAALIAAITGGVDCVQAVQGEERDVHLLRSLDRHLRRSVSTASANQVEYQDRRGMMRERRQDDACDQIIDGNLLLSFLRCSAEERSIALSGWKGPGEEDIRRAVQRTWTQQH